MTRKYFPTDTNAIYSVIGGLSEDNYLQCFKPHHGRRYRYISPANDQSRQYWVGEVWIVDKAGNINPGTNNSPIPISLDRIGRRLKTIRIE